MRRTRLSILMSIGWCGLAAIGMLGWTTLPPWGALLAALALGLAGCGAAYAAGRLADGAAAREVAAVAAGLDLPPGYTDRDVVARMAERLDAASATQSAFALLPMPAAICDGTGRIVAATRGLLDVLPDLPQDATLDALYGDGFLDHGAPAEESLLSVGGRRFLARTCQIGGNRSLVALLPAGSYLADDDLDAFATAIEGGRTAFRFSDSMTRENPALVALNAALVRLDRACGVVGKLLAGIEPSSEDFAGEDTLPRRLRQLAGEMSRLRTAGAAARAEREELEARLAELTETVESHRASAARLAEIAADADVVGRKADGNAPQRRPRKASASARPRSRAGDRKNADAGAR